MKKYIPPIVFACLAMILASVAAYMNSTNAPWYASGMIALLAFSSLFGFIFTMIALGLSS